MKIFEISAAIVIRFVWQRIQRVIFNIEIDIFHYRVPCFVFYLDIKPVLQSV